MSAKTNSKSKVNKENTHEKKLTFFQYVMKYKKTNTYAKTLFLLGRYNNVLKTKKEWDKIIGV